MYSNLAEPHGVMFHHFHGSGHPRSQGSIDGNELQDLLKWYERDYRILPAAEWKDRAVRGALRDRDVCLTFDDNLRCQYDVAQEVLEAFDLTGFWFVYTSPLDGEIEKLELYRHYRHTEFATMQDFYSAFFEWACAGPYGRDIRRILASSAAKNYLEEFSFYSVDDRRYRFLRDISPGETIFLEIMDSMIAASNLDLKGIRESLWMGWPEIKALVSDCHIVGMHSHTHPTRLDLAPLERQRQEYEANQRILSEQLQIDVDTISHPCNAFTPGGIEILREMGIRLGFRGNMDTPTTPMHDLRRQDHIYIWKHINS